ncbi:hypothetical protein ACU6U9_09180 [Pseudomonas sp. HK3]
MIKKILLLSLASASMNSFSAETSLDTSVLSIYAPISGTPFVNFEANTLPGCYGNTGAYMPVTSEASAKAAYSTLLAAQMADKRLRVYYTLNDVASDYAGWGLCTITAISVSK